MLELFSPFKNQSHLAHLGLVVTGAVAFVGGTYATAFLLYDGASIFVASGADAMAARRTAFMVGMTLCWFVFTLGILLTTGGPVLNIFWYPGIIFGLSISLVYPFLFGDRPNAVITDGFLYSPQYVRDHIVVILPGAILFGIILLIAMAAAFDSEEEQREWMERHLSESFLEANNPEYENGEWIVERRE